MILRLTLFLLVTTVPYLGYIGSQLGDYFYSGLFSQFSLWPEHPWWYLATLICAFVGMAMWGVVVLLGLLLQRDSDPEAVR